MGRFVLSLLSLVLIIAVLCPDALAIGEDDPLWNKPTYEKKVFSVGRKLLKAGNITEEVAFYIQYRNAQEKNNANAHANDRFAQVSVESGILKYIESDDELAFVIGHEIGHVIGRHGRKNTIGKIAGNVLVTGPLTVVGAAAGPLGAVAGYGVGNKLNHTFSNLYSQSQEMEADRIGLDLMIRAGYDPENAELLAQKIFSDGAAWKINRNHPMGRDRLAQIQALSAQAKAGKPIDAIKLRKFNKPTVAAGSNVPGAAKPGSADATTAKPVVDPSSASQTVNPITTFTTIQAAAPSSQAVEEIADEEAEGLREIEMEKDNPARSIEDSDVRNSTDDPFFK